MSEGMKSAKFKLLRAAKHLRAIKRCISAYGASEPHKIIAKSKGKKKLNIPAPPPKEVSLIAGEMVYQMRSALDHLAFEVIKLNPRIATISPKWDTHCEFPLRVLLPKNCSSPIAKSAFSRELPGISDKAFAFIESVQPYYSSGGINNCLRFLFHLSNIDKHRRMNLVRTRVRKNEIIRFSSGLTSRSTQALDHGTMIEPSSGWNESDKPVYVNRRFRPFVAFNERHYLGDATDLPVDYLLKLILDQINLVIVPAFERFIKDS
ncbi:MAG: hypothetical protein ABSF45_14820 [Terriglobia bacterium]